MALKADLNIIRQFASDRLGDASTVRQVPRYLDDNCRVEKEHFGGDAPWAQGFYDAWENALTWRKEESAELVKVMEGIGLSLYQVVANYSHADVMAATTINSQVAGFRAGEQYHGSESAVVIQPAK
ncbi:hypothetical protein AB0M46_04315 [Dactylosporangium sp. NPDC051485]|uniref:hypothetical protein n=1 Tax=Dactylosporangium sp. NPDC051485 TaxID=3154846 RepID=UPI003433AE80